MSIVLFSFKRLKRRHFLHSLLGLSVASCISGRLFSVSAQEESLDENLKDEVQSTFAGPPCMIGVTFNSDHDSIDKFYNATIYKYDATVRNGEEQQKVALAYILSFEPRFQFPSGPGGFAVFGGNGFLSNRSYSRGFRTDEDREKWENQNDEGAIYKADIAGTKIINKDIILRLNPKERLFMVEGQVYLIDEGNFIVVEYGKEGQFLKFIQIPIANFALINKQEVLNIFKSNLPDYEFVQKLELSEAGTCR